jgi:flagellar motor component MotA
MSFMSGLLIVCHFTAIVIIVGALFGDVAMTSPSADVAEVANVFDNKSAADDDAQQRKQQRQQELKLELDEQEPTTVEMERMMRLLPMRGFYRYDCDIA